MGLYAPAHRTRYASEESAVRAVGQANRQPIASLAGVPIVTFPFASIYYRPELSPRRGKSKDHQGNWRNGGRDQSAAVATQYMVSSASETPAAGALPREPNPELPPRPVMPGIAPSLSTTQPDQVPPLMFLNGHSAVSYAHGQHPWRAGYARKNGQAVVRIPPMVGGLHQREGPFPVPCLPQTQPCGVTSPAAAA